MTIHYDYKDEDWIALNENYMARSGQLQKQRRVFLFCLLACVLMNVLSILTIRRLDPLLVWVGMLSLGMMVGMPKLIRNAAKQQIKRGDVRSLFGAYDVELRSQGIRVKGPISENLYYWSAVEQVIETETHIFLQFSSAVRITIPKRAFSTQTHGLEFLKLAEHYRQSATGTPIPTMQRGAWWTQGGQVVETQTQRQ